MKNNRIQGFSLIELMIVIVIVGILVAVAYPAYQNHLYRSRRSDGQSYLLSTAALMEHYFTENSTYTGATTTTLGYTDAFSPQQFYQIAISITGGGTTYTLTATPRLAQTGDTSCTSLTLDNNGTRGSSPSAITTCWQ